MPGEKDLHPYQKFCVNFLEEKPQCALFLDCGLGKTIITLTAIAHLLYDSYEVSRVLIIAPLRVARDTWIGELFILHQRCPNAVFSHDEAFYYHGLTDREPLVPTLTVYSGYNTHRLTMNGKCKVYTVKKELYIQKR